MEATRMIMESVIDALENELSRCGWQSGSPKLLENDVVFLPASKDKISLLFQANLRLEGTPRVQPSVAMSRHPAMQSVGCVDFVPADIFVREDGTITSDGAASVQEMVSDGEKRLAKIREFNRQQER